jgi:hypothetical protein
MDTELATCNRSAAMNILNNDSIMQTYLQNLNLMKNFFNFSSFFLQEIENSNTNIQRVSDFLKQYEATQTNEKSNFCLI